MGVVRLVLIPDAMDQTPLQLDAGEIMELTPLVVVTLLVVLAVVSVLAVDLTDELGDRPLLRRGSGRGTGRGACRRPCKPYVFT